jgi:hypothetical protein
MLLTFCNITYTFIVLLSYDNFSIRLFNKLKKALNGQYLYNFGILYYKNMLIKKKMFYL